MGGLATMFLAAFGVTLETIIDIAQRLVAKNDVKIMMLAVTAGVQIRNHVVFVGRDYGDVRTKYPELVIEGKREQADIFNFGALHVLGHVLAHITSNALGQKILRKAGSSVTGEYSTQSEAGTINTEIARSWSAESVQAARVAMTSVPGADRANLDKFFDSIPAMANGFKKPAGVTTGGAASLLPPAVPKKPDA